MDRMKVTGDEVMWEEEEEWNGWNDRDWDKKEANDLVLVSVRSFGAMYRSCILGSMDWEGRTRSGT